ncbi:hypothetical protein NEOLI_004323 [Neolecta irregularis DAH-3]|uniref:Uncharacterized protein n=1 Tax=Neolecta irregularis (strain DAH-3) TaxID=1198029 RepID=A0A1U7LTJ1_NEOID|nr:hypothetical protein NEOLI_004323 [Neolecta irregularis DAH-3]|eukprot:OLL25949.1 hypothetical protein NEOLI_004323 [Neolecta irregularis DAH-3]
MAACPSFASVTTSWTDERCLEISRKVSRREEIAKMTYHLRRNIWAATTKIRGKSLDYADVYDFTLPPALQSSPGPQTRNLSPKAFNPPPLLPTPATKTKRMRTEKKLGMSKVKKAISMDTIRIPERQYQSSPIRKFSTMRLQSSPLPLLPGPPAFRESKLLDITCLSSSPLPPRTPPRSKDSDADLLLHLATSPSPATPNFRFALLTSPSRFTPIQSGNPQTPRDFCLEDFFNASPSPLAKTPGRKLNYDLIESTAKIASGERLTFGTELVLN